MATVGDFGQGTRHAGFKVIKEPMGAFNYKQTIAVEDTQRAYKDFHIRPIGGVSNQMGPFYFVVEPEDNWYLQLGLARLEAVLSVVRKDGSKLQDLNDVVAPNNLLGLVMWESVEPSINGQPLSGASCVNSGYKAFIDTMLSCDTNARNTHLLLALGHMDSPGEYDTMTLPMSTFRQQFRRLLEEGKIDTPDIPEEIKTLPAGSLKADGQPMTELELEKANRTRSKLQQRFLDEYFYTMMGLDPERQQTLALLDRDRPTNLGFETRCKIVANSEKFTLFSPITHDLFNMDNHLGSMNRLDLKLTMYANRFLLNTHMAQNGYKLVLHDLKLHLRSIRLKESIPSPMQETYRMNETCLYKHVVPHGLTNYSFRIQHTGVLPKSIVVTTATTAAVEGHYQKNPFHFHHFFLKRISLFINGEQRPQGGLTFDFKRANQDTARGYHWLFANTGALAGNRGNLISLPHFQAGCFMVPFDLTPDRCNSAHNHNAELGYMDLVFEWMEPLKEPITVLYEMMFNKALLIDKSSGQVCTVDVAA